MKPRTIALGAFLWTLIAASGATGVWLAVSGAGVLRRDAQPEALSLPQPSPSFGAPATAATSPTLELPPTSPAATPTSGASSVVAPAPGVASGSTKTTATTSAPSKQATTSVPVQSPAPTPAPTKSTTSPAPAASPWTGIQGTVLARCSGSVPVLVYARPENGYRVELESEHDGLQVKFDGSREIKVIVRCTSGVPVYRTET